MKSWKHLKQKEDGMQQKSSEIGIKVGSTYRKGLSKLKDNNDGS